MVAVPPFCTYIVTQGIINKRRAEECPEQAPTPKKCRDFQFHLTWGQILCILLGKGIYHQ